MTDEIARDYPYKRTVLKVSATEKLNEWHVTLWHRDSNLDIRMVRSRDIESAARVALSEYILANKFGREVITNLRVIKRTM